MFEFIFYGMFSFIPFIVIVVIIINVVKNVKLNNQQTQINMQKKEETLGETLPAFKQELKNAKDVENQATFTSIKCEYCGSTISKYETKCGSCGAGRQTKK